jgi:acyl carrier protein
MAKLINSKYVNSMNYNKTLEQLQQVFRKVFGLPNLTISPETSAKDINLWDSLTHIELISEIEDTFRTEFLLDEVMHFTCVNDIVNCLHQKQPVVGNS